MPNDRNAPPRLPILSQTAEHALRAVLFLARTHERGLVSATEVASALGAPPNYLAKTLRQLARRGLLRSVRGARGGFALCVAPEALTTAQVVEAVDEVRAAATCLLGARPCDPDRPCDVHTRWAALRDRVVGPMADTTIADLLAEGPLLPIPPSSGCPAPTRLPA